MAARGSALELCLGLGLFCYYFCYCCCCCFFCCCCQYKSHFRFASVCVSFRDFQFQLQLFLATRCSRFSQPFQFASIWRFSTTFRQLINRPRLLFIYVCERTPHTLLLSVPRATAARYRPQECRLRIRHVADGCAQARLGLPWAWIVPAHSLSLFVVSPLFVAILIECNLCKVQRKGAAQWQLPIARQFIICLFVLLLLLLFCCFARFSPRITTNAISI